MCSLNGILLKKKIRTDGRTNGQTKGRTDWRSDYFMPQILLGGIQSKLLQTIDASLINLVHDTASNQGFCIYEVSFVIAPETKV